METFNLETYCGVVEQWIHDAASTIEGRPTCLKSANFPRHPTEINTRNVLQDCYLNLPIPMQTLILALEKIKLGICEDLCRHKINYESKVIADIDSKVSFAKKTIEFYTSQKQEIESLLYIDVSPFQDEWYCIANSSISPTMFQKKDAVEFLQIIDEKIKDMRLMALQNLEEESVKVPIYREPPNSQSLIKESMDAIENSKKMMDRIKVLSGGNIQTYFEVPKMITNFPEESVAKVDFESAVRSKDPIYEMKKLIQFRRRFFTYIQGCINTKKLFLDDAATSCVLTLRQIKVPFHKKEQESVDFNLMEADKKIQEEIKFLLFSLSVDKTAFDQSLRSIKMNCEHRKETIERDLANSFVLKLTQWREELDKIVQQSLY